MKISQQFTVGQPLDVVWAFFHDIPRVAACLPGAEYTGTRDDGALTGKVTTRVGPFQASFEGEANVDYDEAAKTVRLEGKGVDRKGNSRGKMTMDCAVVPVDSGTQVSVDADVQLSGAIAQFGRTGLITEVAGVIVKDFVKNAEAELAASATPADAASPAAPRPTPDATPISGFALLVASLKAWLKSLFKKTT